MKKIDIASMAFQNFRKRKLRSFLTVLGVVIGVASIVVMVSLGIAVNVSFSKEMEQMGDLTLVQVYPNYGVSGGEKDPNKGKLTDDLVTRLAPAVAQRPLHRGQVPRQRHHHRHPQGAV